MWEQEIVTIQFRVPRSFKHSFQDWCDSQGITMSAVLVYWITQKDKIELPPALRKPWSLPINHGSHPIGDLAQYQEIN